MDESRAFRQFGFLLFASVLQVFSAVSSAQPEISIIGGQEVPAGTEIASHTVFLEAKMIRVSFTCTAVVLTDRVLLTAAHCLGGNFWADLNAHFTVNKAQTGLRIKVIDRAAVQWPLPSTPTDWDDIALLRLDKPVPAGYAPTPLAHLPAVGAGTVVTLAGYGINRPQSDGSDTGAGVLRSVDQTILEYPYGQREMRINIEGKGACFGDSGGPAFLTEGGRMVLLGVASRLTQKNKVKEGQGRNPPEYACLHDIVYSQVDVHREWINSVLRGWNLAEIN